MYSVAIILTLDISYYTCWQRLNPPEKILPISCHAKSCTRTQNYLKNAALEAVDMQGLGFKQGRADSYFWLWLHIMQGNTKFSRNKWSKLVSSELQNAVCLYLLSVPGFTGFLALTHCCYWSMLKHWSI